MPARSKRKIVGSDSEARSGVRTTLRPADSPFATKDSTDRGLSHYKRQGMQSVPGSDAAAISIGCAFAVSIARRGPPK